MDTDDEIFTDYGDFWKDSATNQNEAGASEKVFPAEKEKLSDQKTQEDSEKKSEENFDHFTTNQKIEKKFFEEQVAQMKELGMLQCDVFRLLEEVKFQDNQIKYWLEIFTNFHRCFSAKSDKCL